MGGPPVDDRDARGSEARAADRSTDRATETAPAADAEQHFWRTRVPYHDLIEQIRDYAIFCTDPNGCATTWNRGVERVLGFAEHEFIGLNVATHIFTPADIDAKVPQREMEEAARLGAAHNNRWMRKRDGSHFFCLGMTTALHDDAGGLIGFAKVMQDRTAQHDQAEELRAATARLTLANQHKDRFIALLSHELRNPLAPIRIAVEVLRRAPAGSAAARQAVDAVDRQSNHLKHLVDDLLDIARIAQGKIHLEMKRVELNALASSVAEDQREAFDASGLQIAVERAAEPLYVYGDRTRLTQMIANLLDNARKFTPVGGRVTLMMRKAGDEARLQVSDTGIGMTPDLIACAFEPLVQAETTPSRHGGLGLGLALVKGLAELHGGRIEARSPGPARGTDMLVSLPLHTPGELPKTAVQAQMKHGGTRRVLIIEDNADTADMLATALVLRGHQVEVANTVRQGLDTAATYLPDVILCDVGLPDGDGYDVAQRFRALPAFSHVPLIALTGHTLPGDIERARRAGFDRHIAKPPDLDVLDELISSGRLLQPAFGGGGK